MFVTQTTQAATTATTFSISGHVVNATGAALAGVTVQLGGHSLASQKTDAAGNYSFSGLTSGSFTVQPLLLGCGFVPGIADLDNLSANRTQDFAGSGSGCGGNAVPRLTISGQINDANGLPLPGATVLLSGAKIASQKTDASGKYKFSPLVPGSYLVQPVLPNCSFLPNLADLDNVIADAIANFGGSGSGCGGTATVNAGAATGPLTISGHMKDASGNPIVGGRVDLSGGATAVRFSDFSGNYSFHVATGLYTLRASGACTFTPSSVTKNVQASTTQDFAATNTGCTTASPSHTNPTGVVFTTSQGGTTLGTTYARLEARASSDDTQTRLQQIVAEFPANSRSLTIAGYPAIERQLTVTLPGPEGDGDVGDPFIALTAAIAVDKTVVRFESQLPKDASAATIARFFAADRNFTADSLGDLHGPPAAAVPTAPATPGPIPPAIANPAGSGLLATRGGELQIAASDSANAVVYALQNAALVSFDQGKTIAPSTLNFQLVNQNAPLQLDGDPMVAIGSPGSLMADGSTGQYFYYAQLQNGAPLVNGSPNPTHIDAIGLYFSKDNGRTFNPVSQPFPINCLAEQAPQCFLPDQEQLVVDKFNRATSTKIAGVTNDQIYLAWRNYTSATSNEHTIVLACSADGGASWQYDYTSMAFSTGDYPRMAVGPDGSLLVAYSMFADPNNDTSALSIQKFSSCASGFEPQYSIGAPPLLSPVPFPQVITGVTEVTDMAGLDRRPRGNYVPAFDEQDLSGQHVFLVYTNESSAGNDDIHVAESTNGAATWPQDIIVNTNHSGQRFFPFMCSTGGKHFVTWYDRRTSVTNSVPGLTSYFRSSVKDTGAGLSAGTEFDVSGRDDDQCLSAFPSGASASIEETACGSDIPFLNVPAGTCQSACPAGATAPCGSNQPCDFRPNSTACPTGETCTTSRGGPKYGDYNGAACALGTVFMAWASSTPPLGTCSTNGNPCTVNSDCCSGSCINTPPGKGPLTSCAASGTSSCIADLGGPCAQPSDCCSGVCQGGNCFPAVSIYANSTACLGPTCTPPPPPPPPPSPDGGPPPPPPPTFGITVSMTQNQFGGNDICTHATAFTPGGTFTVQYFGIPGIQGAAFADFAGTLDQNGNGVLHDTSLARYNVGCSAQEASTPATVQATDTATGAVATGTMPSDYFCINATVPADFNGGCR